MVKNMKPRKVRAERKRTVQPYRLRVGTPNELGEPRAFPTANACRKAAIAAFKEWEPWCNRYNVAGKEALIRACDRVGNVGLDSPERVTITAAFDEHTGTVVACQLWRDAT